MTRGVIPQMSLPERGAYKNSEITRNLAEFN